MIREIVLWTTVACLVYMLLVFAIYALLLIFAALDNAIRSREARAEDFEVLGSSRFTIPVSVIVPMFNEEAMAATAVQSILSFDYPEYEVIVVDDGSTDRTFEILDRELDLQPRAEFERRVVPSAPVRGTYRSRRHPNVVVVRKENAGTKADACNCGLNFARYRYVLATDGDTVYEHDALLNSMRLVVRDPARVVGVTSHIGVASRPEERAGASADGHELIDATLLSNFQHMEYLRAFLNNRLAWSRLGFMLCASGAFNLWRRDVLEELGGYSPDFSCEDIELTFRVHEHFRRTGGDYRILSLPEMVARTEAPARIASLISQRVRWQRVILETVWHYRRMLFNRRYGSVGLVGVPVYVVSEILAPVFEVLGLASLGAGIVLHSFTWQLYVLFLGSIVFGQAVLTSGAILMEDISTRAYRLRHLVRLLALGPLELLVYRPILIWARLKGTWGFFHGDRQWDKFPRNPRAAEVST